MVHAVQHMREHLLRRGKGTVRDDPLNLSGQLQPACHQHGRTAHARPVKHDPDILAELLYHPVDPHERILPVQTAKTDVLTLALSVRPRVRQQHRIPPLEIIVRQTDIVGHSLAGISVKTDRNLSLVRVFFQCGKIRRMELQTVKGRLIDILVRLCHHKRLSLFHHRRILTPVRARHLDRPLHLRVAPLHRPSVKICDFANACCCQNPRAGHRLFQFSHFYASTLSH